MSDMERAMVIASAAHAGQVDKLGEPYILHVMQVTLDVPPDDLHRTVAILHDVVEDTGWTLAGLAAEGFSPAVLAAVEAIAPEV